MLHDSSRAIIPAWIQRWLPEQRRFFNVMMLHDDSGQELFRLKMNGRAAGYLSPDGQLVLTDSFLRERDIHTNRIQAWTTTPGRPWLWIVGIPLAVGAVLLMLRGLWRWRRHARG